MHANALLLLLGLPLAAHAHFTLRYPTPLGTSAAKQDQAPCGGYSITESTTISNFYVDGDSVAYSSSHPEIKLLLRVVEGNKADGAGLSWNQVFPIVEQYGAGDFCQPLVTVPQSYVGKQGILQVVQNAVDGMLWSCAYVKFVSGTRPSLPDACRNGSDVTAALSSDAALSALMDTTSAPTNSPSAASLHGVSILTGLVSAAVALVFNVGL
ncbi:hypothetical protein DRE_02108 [Drechslerella stenobrocha 248]|uniref:Copper acquisition factor BIM1-like domain-containing protein n=1 Tax=Drechslerella stenobrocha 248 TaxID=1043628 RepID=W7HXT9_9PEZI|nr:hypothetical protein DRE_02108 [Drechslerella stenobrocha 248]